MGRPTRLKYQRTHPSNAKWSSLTDGAEAKGIEGESRPLALLGVTSVIDSSQDP